MFGRDSARRRRIGFLVLPLGLLLLALLPFLQVGFMFLGRQLSPGESVAPAQAAWPVGGEVVSSLTPTLRWPALGGQPYEVGLFLEEDDGAITPVFAALTEARRLEVPAGVLAPDRHYLWLASAVDGGVADSHTGRFATATRAGTGDLTVSPAVCFLNPDTLLEGIDLEVTVPDGVVVEVILPDLLTAAGARRTVMEGSFRLPVRPTLALSTLVPDIGGAEEDLAAITVRTDEETVVVPVRFDASAQGRFLRAAVSGFDPLLDTPAFANFAEGLLARMTQGTCLGMVLAARQSFESCGECGQRGPCWCPRLRLRSMLDPDGVKEEMNFLHLANLNPGNWSAAVASALTSASQHDVAAELLTGLHRGGPVPLAILEERTAGEGPGMGHAVLAYAVHEFEDLYLVYLYDPDRVLRQGEPLRSFMVLSRKPGLAGRVLFATASGLEAVEVHVLPDSRLLTDVPRELSRTLSSLDIRLSREWMDGR
jgi:hypothetical protein